jgi:hypothetical protein
VINFRFHIVSLIAVFLALGLGILVGSTVVDQVIVDRLDKEIRTVSHDSNQLKADNGNLNDQVSKLNDFLRKSAAYAVENRLTAVPVAIVAEKGVDEGAVNSILASVRAAGASAPGVIWLTDKWQLDDPKDLQTLQSATRVSGTVAASRTAAMRDLAARLVTPPATRVRRTRDVLEPLRTAGFVDLNDGKRATFDAFPAHAARVLFLTGTDSHLTATDTMVDLMQALIADDSPTVLGEVYDAHGGVASTPKRGTTLEPVRADAVMAKHVTTFDDGELPQGALTAVLTLQQSLDGPVGHYGYGEGATETLPPLPS